MRRSLFSLCLLLLTSLLSSGQSETHDFVTYDTTVQILSNIWNVRISRPVNLFTANHPDTASRPAIITMPGQGEMGTTDTSKLTVWGPHYWLKSGWDGGIILGNGTHYPILITVAYVNNPYAERVGAAGILAFLLNTYHIKRNSVHIAGLSQGGFAWTDMISYEATPGAQTGMKMVTSLTALSGFSLTNAADSMMYKTWATVYGGKYFGTEGYNDVTRNTWKGAQYVNSVRPGTGYFSYNTVCSGGHGCWNTIYDPNATDWRTRNSGSNPVGPYWSASQGPPFGAGGIDTMGNYKYPSSLFQWMLRQGDSSLAGVASTPPPSPTAINKVIVAEYKTWYIRNDSLIYSYNNGSAFPVQWPIGGRKAVTGAGGFNIFRVIDDQGYIWTSRTDFTTTTDRLNTDTAGNAFNGNIYIDAYANTVVTIRSDSSVWYFGMDSYNLFYTGGILGGTGSGTTMLPTQLSPAGMKFKKVLLGGNKIVGLTTAGDVYVWLPGGSRTPTKMTTPRAAVDIFVSHLDIAGCIIPDAGQTSGMGYPYIWGTATSMYGGSTAFTQPTSIKALWNMSIPVKEISVNWNTIHYIDSLGRLFGCGFNSMGEVGNGQEFVNKYTYPNFPGYGWTFVDHENPSGVPTQIAVGTTWKHLYSNNWFAFYKYAKDANDSIYSWGRNKALDLGNGFINLQEATSPDAMDVLTPTMVHPLMARYQTYNFTAPILNAGADQNVSVSNTTLTATGHAVALAHAGTLFNGIDSVGYHWVAFQWTKVSGPACTITTPTAQTTTVTGMTNGTYAFRILATDNNTGTIVDTVQVIVDTTASQPPTVTAGPDKSVTLPVDSVVLNGNATGHGATIHAIAWNTISGPNAPTFVLTNSGQTATAHGLIQGTYVFAITATDNHTPGLSASDSVTVTVNPGGASILSGKINATGLKIDNPGPTVEQFLLYPTVSHDNESVTLAINSDSMGPVHVSVFDMNGKILQTVQADKRSVHFNQIVYLGRLPAGIYVVQAMVGSGKQFTAKVIRL